MCGDENESIKYFSIHHEHVRPEELKQQRKQRTDDEGMNRVREILFEGGLQKPKKTLEVFYNNLGEEEIRNCSTYNDHNKQSIYRPNETENNL